MKAGPAEHGSLPSEGTRPKIAQSIRVGSSSCRTITLRRTVSQAVPTTGTEISLLLNSNFNLANRPVRTKRACPTGAVHVEVRQQLVRASR